MGLPWWLSCKESASKAGALGNVVSVPGSGKSPEEGHGNSQQYSCLENPMDRGSWRATVHRVAKSQTTEVAWHARTQTCCYINTR